MRHPRRGKLYMALHQTVGQKIAKRIVGNGRQIGDFLTLPTGRHGDIEGRAPRIGNIMRQTVRANIARHEIYEVFTTNGNHSLYPL